MKYKILLSDDNESLFEPFKDIAFKFNPDIELSCHLDWESAQTELETNGIENYVGLIIDGQGWLTSDDKQPTNKHVMAAVNWLNEQKGNGNILPTIIYTAFLDIISDFSVKNDIIIGIEDKGIPFEQILQKLITNHLQDPTNRIRFKYKNVLNVFNNDYLPEHSTPIFIDLLSKLDEQIVDKKNFNSIRDLIEEMLKRAAYIDNNFLPGDLLNPIQNNRPNLTLSVRYLIGHEVDLSKCGGSGKIVARQEIMPTHIGWIYSSLVQISNIFSHNYQPTVTNYAYKNAVFGLCEVLLWFKDYCNQKYNL